MPWISDLTQREGPNILRCKGIVAFQDEPKRFVFQGVHMILDGDLQGDWKPGEKRESRRRVHRPRPRRGRHPRGLSAALRRLEPCVMPLSPQAGRGDKQQPCRPNSPPRSPRTSHRSTPARMSRRAAWLGDTAGASRSATAPCCSRRTARRTGSRRIRTRAILAAAGDGERLVTGGDDGRVAVTGRDGSTRELAATERRLDRRARAPPRRRPSPGAPARASPPATTRAARRPVERAFRRARPRLRAEGLPARDRATTTARRCGSRTLEAKPELLEWKGSHLDVTWSPDGALPRHLDAGERAAWLAPAAGQGPHAHVRLPGEDALLVVVA